MGVTAKEVNELRQKTGAGLMDCKKALTEAGGDMDAAIDYLRKKGQKVSALRAGKEANEGVVIAKTSEDNKRGVVIYLSCETDFVAKNADFIAFAEQIASLALEKDPATLEELNSLPMDGVTVKDKVNEQVGVINENISLNTFEKLQGETVVAYNHAGYKIGVLLALNETPKNGVLDVARDLAMQVAAMNPLGVDKDDVDSDVVERELAIGREQALAEGKPENIVDKIAQGKLQKFYKESTLLNQQFVKDGSKTVQQVLKEVDNDLKVTKFKRVALGS